MDGSSSLHWTKKSLPLKTLQFLQCGNQMEQELDSVITKTVKPFLWFKTLNVLKLEYFPNGYKSKLLSSFTLKTSVYRFWWVFFLRKHPVATRRTQPCWRLGEHWWNVLGLHCTFKEREHFCRWRQFKLEACGEEGEFTLHEPACGSVLLVCPLETRLFMNQTTPENNQSQVEHVPSGLGPNRRQDLKKEQKLKKLIHKGVKLPLFGQVNYIWTSKLENIQVTSK